MLHSSGTMSIFVELSILIAVATLMAVAMRLLKQPLIIGHILTGLIVGPFVFDLINSTETLRFMSEFGVAILLFTVGLHLNPSIVREFGRVSILTGLGQVTITGAAGYATMLLLGYEHLTAFYVGIALAFSSTIIIMKLIGDKGDLEVLYARIAIGFLLIQDIIAVFLLLGIPLFASGASLEHLARFLGAGIALVAFIYATSRFLLPRVNGFIEESREFLLLFAIMWGIGIAALFKEFGFSLESGALIAGVSLATIPSRHEISSRLSPLRDFFIIIFFIFLGAQLQLGSIRELIGDASILSVLILVGNPLILIGILGYLGYRKKTSLQTGMTVAQISEFSLILIALGISLGHLEPRILSLVTIVGIITIFGSTYLVLYSDKIYKVLAPLLNIFERVDAHEPRPRRHRPEIVLFGCNRIGYDFAEALIKSKRSFLVVDYDPETVKKLSEAEIDVEFGDASNVDFLDTIDFSRASLVISTIPDAETNLLIHRTVKSAHEDAIVMVVAHRIAEALSHYEEGIDYVILPHFLGARHAADIVLKYGDDKDKYGNLRERHLENLQLRIAIGHDHPHPSKN